MLRVHVRNGTELVFEDPPGVIHLVVTLMRTLRLPDDGNCYPLPAGLGPFPLRDVAEYRDRVPVEWLKRPGVIVPMYSCEALWISIESKRDHPNAIKVGAGLINAVSGEPWDPSLRTEQPPSFLNWLLVDRTH